MARTLGLNPNKLGKLSNFVVAVPSAFGKVDGETSKRGLLVFRLHVPARLAHGRDDLVERYDMRSVALQREGSGVDGFDCAKCIALDAGYLHQTADRIAGHPEVMFHADF